MRLHLRKRPEQGEAGGLYFCPAAEEVESPAHGGFTICCDRPGDHLPLPAGPATQSLSRILSDALKARHAQQHTLDPALRQVRRLDRMAEAWAAELPDRIRTAAAVDAIHAVTRPNGQRP